MKRTKLAVLGAAALVPLASALLASAAGENLLVNGDFSNGTAGWLNKSGNPQVAQPGYLKVTNTSNLTGVSYGSAYQCVTDVSAGDRYRVMTIALVPGDAMQWGGASAMLQFFSSANCSGLPTSSEEADGGFTPATRDTRLSLQPAGIAPKGTQSIRVMLSAKKQPAPDWNAPGELTVTFAKVELTREVIFQASPNVEFNGPKIVVPIPQPEPPEPELPEPQLPEPAIPESVEPEPLEPAIPGPQQPANPGASQPQQPAPGSPSLPSAPGQPQQSGGNVAPQPQPGQQASASGQEHSGPASSETADETAVGPDSGTTDSESSTGPGTTPLSPLPPATGMEPDEVRNFGWLVIAGCLAAIAAGGMMVLFAARNRRDA